MTSLSVGVGGVAPVPPLASPEKTETIQSRDDALRQSAQDFETVFISQMLQYTGFAKALSQDTGSGSDAFASMHLTHIAEDIAASGGFGLQDQIYETLKGKEAGE